MAVHLAALLDFGRSSRGMSMMERISSSQSIGVDVEQHGPGGIGNIGDVQIAACQVPHQPGIDRPEGQLALFFARSRAPSTLSRIHLTLVPEK